MKYINLIFVILLFILACSKENKDSLYEIKSDEIKDSLYEINKNAIKDYFEAIDNNYEYKAEYNSKIWKEYLHTYNNYIFNNQVPKKVDEFIKKHPTFLPIKISKTRMFLYKDIYDKNYIEKYIKELPINDTIRAIINYTLALRNQCDYKKAMLFIDESIKIIPNNSSFYFSKVAMEPDIEKQLLIIDEACKRDMPRFLSYYCSILEEAEKYSKIINLINKYNKTLDKNPDYDFLLKIRARTYEKLNDIKNAEKDYLKMIELEKEKSMILIAFYKRNNYSKTQILEKIKDLIKNHNYKLEYFYEYKDDKELLKMLDKK